MRGEGSVEVGHLPIPDDVIDVSLVVDGDEQAPRPAVDEAELLARESHGRRVNDGHELVDVLRQEAEEEALVAVLQPAEQIDNRPISDAVDK